MKNLDYYMSLPYEVVVETIPAHLGGGFKASIPILGRFAVYGDGDTVEEALADLSVVKQERLGAYISEGLDIPEPQQAKTGSL